MRSIFNECPIVMRSIAGIWRHLKQSEGIWWDLVIVLFPKWCTFEGVTDFRHPNISARVVTSCDSSSAVCNRTKHMAQDISITRSLDCRTTDSSTQRKLETAAQTDASSNLFHYTPHCLGHVQVRCDLVVLDSNYTSQVQNVLQ